MVDEFPRSRQAREAAEQALVRVVHHYGDKPEFVVLGGLVPELLCSRGSHQHAGITDIDVQVNLEIECGAVNTERLERAVIEKFCGQLPGIKTSLDDLAANFADPKSQGPVAYSDQYLIEYPDIDVATAKADAIIGVETFYKELSEHL